MHRGAAHAIHARAEHRVQQSIAAALQQPLQLGAVVTRAGSHIHKLNHRLAQLLGLLTKAAELLL